LPKSLVIGRVDKITAMIGRAGQVDHDHPVVVGAVYLTTVMAGTVSHADISITPLSIIYGAIAIDVNIDAPALNRAINRTARQCN
jgi:hypothetical protein